MSAWAPLVRPVCGRRQLDLGLLQPSRCFLPCVPGPLAERTAWSGSGGKKWTQSNREAMGSAAGSPSGLRFMSMTRRWSNTKESRNAACGAFFLRQQAHALAWRGNRTVGLGNQHTLSLQRGHRCPQSHVFVPVPELLGRPSTSAQASQPQGGLLHSPDLSTLARPPASPP